MKKFEDMPWERKEKIYRAVVIISMIVIIISTACNIYAYRTLNTIYELMQVEELTAFLMQLPPKRPASFKNYPPAIKNHR
jgi:hypothetical protein